MEKQLLSTGDVLELLGLEKTQRHKVEYMVEAGMLKPLRLRKMVHWRFRRADVVTLIGGAA
jgi:hypothetical protein